MWDSIAKEKKWGKKMSVNYGDSGGGSDAQWKKPSKISILIICTPPLGAGKNQLFSRVQQRRVPRCNR